MGLFCFDERMQRIIPVQQCRSLDGWVPIQVDSSSDPDKKYVVHVNPWGIPTENICECKGFQYRGSCRHQIAAVEDICGWHEMHAHPQHEIQSDHQREELICPRCDGPTMYVMEVVEDKPDHE